MARAMIEFLSKQEEDLIHEKSIEILKSMGVLVRSAQVLKLLEEFGAEVDYGKRVAKISEELIREALSKAPRRIKLYCRESSRNNIEIPSDGIPFLSTDGLTLYMIDLETGERRNAKREDFSKFAKLADALDAVSFFWPIVTISDVPENLHNVYELWESLKSCQLHVQGDCLSREDAIRQMEVAALIAGSDEDLKKRPIFSCAIDPIAPLSFDAGAVEAQVAFARAGIPVLCHSMSLSGMSSPVTVAGTITNVHAENLASITITQIANPGAPHIYGSSSTPIDMMTGAINYSAPEGLLISAGAGQMARKCGRPCMVSDWGAGVRGLGMRSSFSELFSHLSTTFSGSDLVPGIGGIDDAKGCSLAQMVIDSFIWDNFRAFHRTFSVSETNAAIDVVKEVGHGNSFLTHQHTMRNFRKELFFWDAEKLGMEATLSDSMIPKAKEISKELLRSHEVASLDRDILSDGELLLKGYAKNLMQ